MADTIISYTIPAAYVPRILAAMQGLYPIPQSNQGTDDEPDMRPDYTPGQWAKECARRWIKTQVQRWEQKAAQQTAADGVIVPDEIIS